MNELQAQVTAKYANDNRWQKAKIVYEYDGALYCEKFDQYFQDIDDLYEHLAEEERHVEWVYGCHELEFTECDAEYLFEEAINDELYNSAWDDVKESCSEEIAELNACLKKFAKSVNENVKSYTPDYQTIFVLPE